MVIKKKKKKKEKNEEKDVWQHPQKLSNGVSVVSIVYTHDTFTGTQTTYKRKYNTNGNEDEVTQKSIKKRVTQGKI